MQLTSHELFDGDLIANLRPVLAWWVDVEQRNVRLFRNGLRSAPTPSGYTTNQIPGGGMESLPPLIGAELAAVAASLTEILERVGRRFYHSGYGHGLVHTALLLRWLEKVVPRIQAEGSTPREDAMNLWMVLGDSAREAFSREDAFAEIDALLAVVENHPAMRAVVDRTTRDLESNARRLREALVAMGRLPPP